MFAVLLATDPVTLTGVPLLMSNLEDVFEAVIGMISDVVSTVTGSPILLLFALIPLVGIGVGLFRRLLNVN